ncbi:asparagine synthase (glutamine-hydrolyzing) [Azonexus hydrophilus]|jgi:asparagine synthase (glutamine-hydrolysing)|uniref:asparagine synthase (glutamine-hydrolyzing) n=1 Tax=Azonexus hydrophilus TaxID=418702 RepID=A0ABZ2XGE8_9RHOO|nr:asparagine synthase (glutamine-hydrolyzing) [Azonexus hydrophilus]MBS4017141.1 asparagine synthase (glutamine-hydrolyzing) [Dechloromonas sp.]
MCGILGMVGKRWHAQAGQALSSIASRGPDAQTVLAMGEALFAHTRLAVIDLAGGQQPMQTADGRYTIVFNGEIYNAPDLRRELQSNGESFRTDHSDTEVLLLGFRAWGEALLEKLDGMFAFAIWDARTGELFAARDALGIKPFMYGIDQGELVFASTLAPFFTLTGFPRRLDPEALRDYLAFQTPLAPQTFLRDVRQLPPGACMRYRAGEATAVCRQWWTIPRESALIMPEEALLPELERVLRTSMARQQVADVPIGAFLSGGIDSSLLVSYLAESSRQPVETFSLKFADQGFDESMHAAQVAERFGCRHHVLEAPSIDADRFVAAIRDLDQPLADPAYVMTHALAGLTRQHVTVAISGDGGDELFGGYPRFTDTESRHPARFWQRPLRAAVDAGLLPSALLRRSLSGRELLHYRRVELGPWVGRKRMAHYLDPAILPAARIENTLDAWLRLIDAQGGVMDSTALMRADLWTYLSENCLAKTDRASMAHGLEVRVPLLGQPVLDFALAVPASVHLRGGLKSLLTGLARQRLPSCVWDRPKHGFSVPLRQLFKGSWREVGDACFAGAQAYPFLSGKALAALWQQVDDRHVSSRLVYTLLVLLVWLENKDISIN